RPDGRAGGNRHFAPDLDRRLAAFVEALERGLSDDPVAGPTAELGPDDDLGLRPDDVLQLPAPAAAIVPGWRRVERRLCDLERLEDRPDPFPCLGREPGPDLPGEPQLQRAAFRLVHADDHGHELRGRALARRVAADDELLLGPALDL